MSIDHLRETLFSKENPFFKQGEVKEFKASSDSITAFYHKDYFESGKSYVCFGYWEFSNAKDSKKCFVQMREWACELGVKFIVGPMNFSSLHDYRISLDNSESFFSGEPKGSKEQLSFLDSFGFGKQQEYSTYYINNPKKIYEWGHKISKKFSKQESSYKAIYFNEFDYSKRKKELHKLIHDVFKENPFYIKANEFELDLLYNEKRLLAFSKNPFFMIEDMSGKLVGLFVSYMGPDVFTESVGEALYYKTIGTLPSKEAYNPVFFFMLNEIYENCNQIDKPLVFAMMRAGNVAEKVAKKFSDKKRSYALFELKL